MQVYELFFNENRVNKTTLKKTTLDFNFFFKEDFKAPEFFLINREMKMQQLITI